MKPGEVMIVGKCISAKKLTQGWAHLVVMPAPDPYSSPSTVEVMARNRLVEGEQNVSFHCRVAGYRRSYKKTDEYGEQRTVQTADNRLYVIED